MQFRLLLPYTVLIEQQQILQLVLETAQGSFGLLPHRLDCIAAIVPGILTYHTADAREHYIAVDSGVMVKAGNQVTLSVRHASIGSDLGALRSTVEQVFLQQSAQQKQVHAVMQKMESDFTRRLVEFNHDA